MAHSPVWCLCLSPRVSRNTFEYGLSEFLVCDWVLQVSVWTVTISSVTMSSVTMSSVTSPGAAGSVSLSAPADDRRFGSIVALDPSILKWLEWGRKSITGPHWKWHFGKPISPLFCLNNPLPEMRSQKISLEASRLQMLKHQNPPPDYGTTITALPLPLCDCKTSNFAKVRFQLYWWGTMKLLW